MVVKKKGTPYLKPVYAIVYGDPQDQKEPPFSFYRFVHRKDALISDQIKNAYDYIIYGAFRTLRRILSIQEIEDILVVCNPSEPLHICFKERNHKVCVQQLHRYIYRNAVRIRKIVSEYYKRPKKRKKWRGRKALEFFDRGAGIIVLKDISMKKGSNRYRNQKVILDSSTVEEALERLSKLPSPGDSKDIRAALEQGVIELARPKGHYLNYGRPATKGSCPMSSLRNHKWQRRGRWPNRWTECYYCKERKENDNQRQ